MGDIVIHRLLGYEEFEIVPLKRKRSWMDRTDRSYAYECMPLNIANEYGWAVLSPTKFSATWDGTESVDCIKIEYHDKEYKFAHSHFGHGVLTISVDFVLQTPPTVSTYIRGIPNDPILGLQPLDAIVETDWLPFTFTYNYKFIKPCTVTFEANEPLFTFFPIQRGEIESYSLDNRFIEENKELFKEYQKYADSRSYYLDNMDNPEVVKSTQRYYSNAKKPDGGMYNVLHHLKKVMLKFPKGLYEKR